MALLAGTALGILSGLGVGGGSLLLLWLTLAVHMDASQARLISLLFFFPASLLSCILKRRQIPWKILLPAMAAGSLAALVFSLLARFLDPEIFRKALGLLLVFTGIRQLFPTRHRPEGTTRR